MKRISILGAEIDPLTLEEAVNRTAALVASGGAHQIVTLNPEYLYRAQRERDLLEIAREAALVTADGIGIVWAARVHGFFLPERVTGIDLLLALCRRAAAEGWRVFLLGGRPGVAAEAAARLARDYPGLTVAGTHHGYFSGAEETGVLERIKAAQPQLLFVGLGAPKQERWIFQRRAALGSLVAVGVGGSFDVLSGRAKRAPAWMRRLGLEWLGRLVLEPRRWRRMLVLPLFALLILRMRIKAASGCGGPAGPGRRGTVHAKTGEEGRKVPKVVISGYYGFGNSGDEAMLFAIISQLKQRIPELEVVVLSQRPQDTAKEFSVRAIPRRTLGLIWRELKNADLLLSGGGSLFQDVTSPRNVLYYAGIIIMAWFWRKKICIYGQGIGPLNLPLSRLLVKLVLRVADLVTLRDKDSLAEIETLGVRRPVQVTADPVLALEVSPDGCERGRLLLQEAGAQGGPLLGISLRRWPNLNAALGAVAELADTMSSRGWRVVLVPLQPDDAEVLAKLKEQMRSPAVLLENVRGFRDLLAVAACFDLCLGMRLHFLIFTVMSGVPAVGLGYDPKVGRFMSQVGLPTLPMASITAGNLRRAVEDLLAEEDIGTRLVRRVEELRRRAWHNADSVAALLRSGK